MSLQQIKHIRSVGRFRACGAEGDVAFNKFTLIFGENGRGKTTLCSILRSLQSNEPAIIVGRKTLGDAKDPHIVLTFADGAVLYKDGGWTRQHTKLRIFDSQYIAENVYFGDEIGTEQRRNLCRVMLGKDGVDIANRYDAADQAITAKNIEIKDARKTLNAHVPTAQIDEFVALKVDADIDRKIDTKTREVDGLREIDNLRTRSLLQALEFPPVPARLEEILAKTLDGLSRDAEARVKAHLAKHNMEGQEDWLSIGLEHASDTCPFCDQSLKGLDLIATYRAFFNDAYATFLQEQEQYKKLPSKHYSDDKIELFTSRLKANESSGEVWKRYVAFEAPTLNDDVTVIARFRDEMIKLLDQKSADPLVSVALSQSYRDALEALTALGTATETYNRAVSAANVLIEGFKKSATSTRLQSVQNELKWLLLTKKRFEQPFADACVDYVRFGKEKDALEKSKATARTQLDKYSETVVKTYLSSINTFLRKVQCRISTQKAKGRLFRPRAELYFLRRYQRHRSPNGIAQNALGRTKFSEHAFIG